MTKKLIEERTSWREVLYILQSTPRTPEGIYPARLFFQCQLRIPHLLTLPDGMVETIEARKMVKKKRKAKEKRNEDINKGEVHV